MDYEKAAQIGQLEFGYVDWDDELPHTKERWRKVVREICQLEVKPVPDFEGEEEPILQPMRICPIEPKPDEGRLLTDEEITDAQVDYLKAEGAAINVWGNFPLKGERRDDCIRKAQRDLTASDKDVRIRQLERHLVLVKAESDGYGSDLLDVQKDCIQAKAECQARVERIFSETEGYVKRLLLTLGIEFSVSPEWQVLKKQESSG